MKENTTEQCEGETGTGGGEATSTQTDGTNGVFATIMKALSAKPSAHIAYQANNARL